jgi:signal transduction histidine kinase
VRSFRPRPGGRGENPLGSRAWVGHAQPTRASPPLPPALAEIAAGWPFAASLAAAAASTVWRGRRRTALNEALHELRRPLQALALLTPSTGPEASRGLCLTLQMATEALERLDREINGAPPSSVHEALAARPLVEAAVARWRARAAQGGGSLLMRWQAADALIRGDGGELGGALDNLLANAIEHGGPRIELRATLGVGWLRLAVLDGGREALPRAAAASRRELLARLAGRRRHGHGLKLVRRTAVAHGGEFRLRTSASGSEAVLELPLLSGETST